MSQSTKLHPGESDEATHLRHPEGRPPPFLRGQSIEKQHKLFTFRPELIAQLFQDPIEVTFAEIEAAVEDVREVSLEFTEDIDTQ